MKLQLQIHDTFFLFGVRSTCRGVLCSAMDGDEESTSLRGLRLKWQKLSHGISTDVESHEEHVDGDSHVMHHVFPDASSSVFPAWW